MMKTTRTAANTTDEEEGELVTHDDLLEPQERLSKLRECVAEVVKNLAVVDGTNSPANYDIDHNIREIRAILKMNEEILDRCMKFSAGGGKSATSFTRIMYKVVKTRARNDGTQIITRPKRTTKEFDTTPLSKLPKGLDNIIVSDNMTEHRFSSFIDFEAFFEKSLVMHETVLEPFLPKLKEHLMTIQVCLGKIDSWVIQETQENISFLEETFETKMEIPDDDDQLGSRNCNCETHGPCELCLGCGEMYCEHYYKYSKKRCNKNDPYNLFQCQYYQILKQCNDDVKFEATFDVTDEQDKARLKKLLELMAMY
ncbi:hypothetical protein ACHAWC_004332 [Mediolabrus comicus]